MFKKKNKNIKITNKISSAAKNIWNFAKLLDLNK